MKPLVPPPRASSFDRLARLGRRVRDNEQLMESSARRVSQTEEVLVRSAMVDDRVLRYLGSRKGAD